MNFESTKYNRNKNSKQQIHFFKLQKYEITTNNNIFTLLIQIVYLKPQDLSKFWYTQTDENFFCKFNNLIKFL